MVKTSTNNIRKNIRPVQQKGNGVDYGLFAIAFAVTLAFGNKTEMISYDKGNLRHHLFKCLKWDKFSPFPRVKRARGVTISQDVYCICRRRYFKEDKDDSADSFLAPCCVCYEWYHKKCMNLFPSDSVAKLRRCKPCK